MGDIEMVREKIVQYQANNNLSDQQMAELIGCSRPLYQRTRTGRVPLGSRFIKGALKLLEENTNFQRTANLTRETNETSFRGSIELDGSGEWEIDTGIPLFDHFLSQMVKHGKLNLTLKGKGDDIHHVIEDAAICLGKAFNEALGDKKGIDRMAHAIIPMDESLALVAVDISGRGYAVVDIPLSGNDAGGIPGDMIRHFLETFAAESKINLHVMILKGTNDHHKIEAVFKGLGSALDAATRIDPRIISTLPTTKGYLEN